MWLPSVRQKVKLLAGIISWTYSGHVCTRNMKAFTMSPVCDGGCVVVSDTDSLHGAGSTSSLIPVGLIREQALTRVGVCLHE